MDEPKVAKANAKVLHDFFAGLKKEIDYVRFSFVTGITRYALTSMDSGPNHLNDISLDSNYAGICGFPVDEFDSLFADRMEATLLALQKDGLMPPEATAEALKDEIFDWYDGYDWGAKTKILNPYSILKFFANREFTDYWIQSGKPDHLTALIKKRPLDFLEPKLESYSSEEIRKSSFTRLEVTPVLFHSGYLTLDKITPFTYVDRRTKKTKTVKSYSFRLPNHEVSSSYYRECFKDILGLTSDEVLNAKAEALKTAILKRDAKAVSGVFESLLRSVTFYQKLRDEKEFHRFIQMALSIFGFKLLSEIPGAIGRLDLLLDLSDGSRQGVYCVTELKYCPDQSKMSEDDINEVLAKAARRRSSRSVNKSLAMAVENKLTYEEFDKVLSKIDTPEPTEAETDRILAKAASEYLTKAEIEGALARTARNELSKEEIKAILKTAKSTQTLSKAEIDSYLSKAAMEALGQIVKKDYHGPIKEGLKAKEIIDLGLSMYGSKAIVKAVFGPEPKASTL
jgi:hypothetical protein